MCKGLISDFPDSCHSILTEHVLCRLKAASYKELEQRMDRQEKLRSIASEMSHKKALMVSQISAKLSRMLMFNEAACTKQ